jgi:Holliday junction resolvasome RuvABC DNA-binding subunit
LNLGYHRPTAEKAVDRTLQNGPDLGFEQALRAALKLLSR